MIFKKIFSNKKDTKNGNRIDAGTEQMKEVDKIVKKRSQVANSEFEKGYNLIKKYPRSVSILGSARFKEDNIYYQKARSLSSKIVKELGYAVVTGGGPGIMEGANRGAFEAGGTSLGFNIILPHEQSINKYVTDSVDFEYFFSRKTLLFFGSESYVYFPGGFGTLDEFFEMITLIQTGKINPAPIILVGREFWEPVLELMKNLLLEKFNTINIDDLNIYKIVDDENEIVQIIKNAPFRQE
ncbi:MAG: TIGR00730 family Rossman fold protein [Candidatus Paceibacterota bacterium]|jgi:hypothetical protein